MFQRGLVIYIIWKWKFSLCRVLLVTCCRSFTCWVICQYLSKNVILTIPFGTKKVLMQVSMSWYCYFASELHASPTVEWKIRSNVKIRLRQNYAVVKLKTFGIYDGIAECRRGFRGLGECQLIENLIWNWFYIGVKMQC